MRFERDRRSLHQLYRGRCPELTSTDPARVLDALLLHLDYHLGPPAGLVQLEVLALVRDDRAVLVPKLFFDAAVRDRRRLQQAGWERLDAPAANVDLDRGELVVTRRFPVDRAALEQAASLAPRRRRDPGLPDGRYPIDAWLFLEPFGTSDVSYSRAASTRIALSAVATLHTDVDASFLHRIAAMFDRVRTVPVAIDWQHGALPYLLPRP